MTITRARRWVSCWLGPALGACLLFWSGAASAHASLVSAQPVAGSMLATVPERVTLDFNEPVSPLVMRLATPAGELVRLGGVTVQDRAVTIAIPPSARRGSYVLSWRVVSLDGHPIGGSLLFSVGEEGGRAGERAAPSQLGFVAAFVGLKLVFYLALMMGVGGAVSGVWLNGTASPRSNAQAIVIAAIFAGIPATVLLVGLQGLDALDAPADALTQMPVWRAGLDTSFGFTAIMAAFTLFAGLVVALAFTRVAVRGWSGIAWVGIGLTLAASGHASAASPQILMRPSVFLHVVTVALWVGSLLPLMRALRDGDGSAFPRFSRAIPFVLLVLIASGVVLAFVQVVRFDALWTTNYGLVLMAKLALVAALFGIAAFNRFVLTAPASRGDKIARTRLRRTITAEIAIVIAILGVASIWRFTPPPRSIIAAAQAPDFVHLHGAQAMADVTFAPPEAGRRNVSIYVQTPDFKSLEPKEVTLALSNPAAGIEPMTFAARRAGDGVWSVVDVPVPTTGLWTVRVDILVNDFERAVLEDAIELRR